jgi:hypothetical protein
MRNNVAREIIRQRRARNMIMPYMEHINKIVKVQGQVRVFLARRKLTTLKMNEEDIDQEIASSVIQRNVRIFLFKKNNRHAARITRFIRRLPGLRERRLRKIRENLSIITIQQAARRWIRNYHYIELPRFNVNIHQPAPDRIQTYINDRNVRRDARQHNWDVLNRRLRTIRRDIDSIITPDPNRPDTARHLPNINIQLPNRVERPVQTPFITGLHDNRLIHTPGLPPAALPPAAPVFPPIPVTPIRGRRRYRDIPIRTPTPPQQQIRPNIRNRLHEIERQFNDPRIRAIYQNNRIIMPDGNRVLPAAGGGIRLQPDPHPIGAPYLPDSPIVSPTHARECPICLDTKADFRMIDPGCNHLVCFKCSQGMITTALGNITTNIPIKCPMSQGGCEKLITPYTQGVKALMNPRDYDKFEKYYILKLHVPPNRLRYCPNSGCGMPFEINDDIIDDITSPPSQVNFRLSASCLECETFMCIYCNDFAHPNLSCMEFQQRQQDGSEATSEYMKNYCKKCPLCKVNVQKQQMPEQEYHERTTGMAGGTSECHHVTCGSCKGDFCWTCLKTYSGAAYYHRTCPNSDCIISFFNSVPSITHLPLGQQSHIKMIIYDQNTIESQKVYQINNSQVILGARPEQYDSKNGTVILHCKKDGVVKRLEGLLGDYSFRQNNKL